MSMHLREMTAHEVRDSYRAMTSPVQTPLTDRVFVGQRLTAIRKALGLNAAELCREVGLKPNTWSQWEKGKRIPDLHYMMRLVEIYPVTLDYVYLGQMEGLPYDFAIKLRSKLNGSQDLGNGTTG